VLGDRHIIVPFRCIANAFALLLLGDRFTPAASLSSHTCVCGMHASYTSPMVAAGMTKDMYETMRTHANLKSSWRNARLQCTCHRARTHCADSHTALYPGFHMRIRAFTCASGLSHAHPGFPGSIDRVVSGQLDLLAKYGWRPIEMRLEPEVAMSLSTKRLHAGNAVLRSPWVRGPLVVLLARSVLAASLRRWIGRHEVQAGLPHACRRMRPTIDPGQFPTVQGNSKERSRASCCSVYRLSLFDTAAKRQRASLRRRRPLIAVYT